MRHALLIALAFVAVFAAGCRGDAPPPAPVAPISSWTADDSASVAKDLVDAALKQPWTSQFRDRNGRIPKVVIGTVDDRSGDHVDTAAFAQALTANLAANDKVALVAQAPDFTAQTVILMSPESKDGVTTNFFRISLRFVDNGEPPVSLERQVVVQQPAK